MTSPHFRGSLLKLPSDAWHPLGRPTLSVDAVASFRCTSLGFAKESKCFCELASADSSVYGLEFTLLMYPKKFSDPCDTSAQLHFLCLTFLEIVGLLSMQV